MVLWLASGLGVVLVAYLLGAIPTGYWAGKLLQGIDIREHGSKSTGATNVLRTLGKGPALTVLLIDVFKGVTAVLLARWIYSLPAIIAVVPDAIDRFAWTNWVVTLAALMAMVGHSRSIWINFTGGKSAATGLGVLFAMAWQVGLGVAVIFGLVLAIFRIVSLSSIAAAIGAIGLMWAFRQPLSYQLIVLAGGLYVIWRHKANIQRLVAGTEPKIGQKHQESELERS
ncbi:glycerol-3-phosphate 1-O-acyltransferase PlsY [Thermocoleostomius sinensis]|jgi:glycerol-3-phosphate acyltransferase PlsY|uniref:Glycerol-3-phosphate acyltransferase n=1 Tax=Thermocoleostomius sinensis A174 TaxID=2016057 RepID=A0A9E8ZAQ8_9CYAN|nr:glycerol-3-phosphate 1-O-acyltransferase PlsY [Thermocoleostomius sinensis]WAL59724.1 glycerol-3-phosphate 1-O-acyltransferase PlsY [Thermocoleostomius sinensis A174]